MNPGSSRKGQRSRHKREGSDSRMCYGVGHGALSGGAAQNKSQNCPPGARRGRNVPTSSCPPWLRGRPQLRLPTPLGLTVLGGGVSADRHPVPASPATRDTSWGLETRLPLQPTELLDVSSEPAGRSRREVDGTRSGSRRCLTRCLKKLPM